MRKVLLITSIFIFQISLIIGQNVAAKNEGLISDHLIEVNKQWEGKTSNHQTISFDSEDKRIQFHLTQVLEYLEKADLAKLTHLQKENRKRTVQHLRKYKDQAVFPKNDVLPIRNPIFKDQYQTACAVAHLMEKTGAQEVVNLIQSESNFDYIEKLSKNYPQITTWASEHGFTVDELALIQPAYPPEYREFYPVGNGGPVDGKINVMKTTQAEDLIIMAGSFSEIDGVQAQNIIAWDGEDWVDLESPIVGEIHDVSSRWNSLVVVGDFYLEGNPDLQNIAALKDGEWIGLQSGDMEGIIKTIHFQNAQYYIGGDFKKVNGKEIAYLAKTIAINFDDVDWNNDQEFWLNGATEKIENAFSVNGPVNTIITVEDKILIAGLFDQTAIGVEHELIDQLEVRNVVFWKTNWINQMNQPFNEILSAAYINNKIYLSDTIVENNMIRPRVHTLSAGFWDERLFKSFDDTEEADQKVFGFYGNNDRAFAYGNIEIYEISMTLTAGFLQLSFLSDHGVQFDNTVRAVASLGDRLYFAGDFTHAEGTGLVSSDLEAGTNATHDLGLESEINVFVSEKNLQIEYENLKDNLNFSLYTSSGQLVQNFDLAAGNANIQKNLAGLSDGVYIYQLHDGKKMYSSKLSVF